MGRSGRSGAGLRLLRSDCASASTAICIHQNSLDLHPTLQQRFRMEKSVIQAVEKQATHELYAAQSYLALAYWSDVRQYSGFAEFFHEQVLEERKHADKFLKFLADRDV